MKSVNITSLYAAIFTFYYIALSFNVVYIRRRERIGLGFGDNKALQKAIRIHGNFYEYVMIALLLLLLVELQYGSAVWLHAFGITLLVGRVLHNVGISKSVGLTFGRFYGSVLSWGVIITLACFNLVAAL